ncbi:MAG: (2Fe-2S)-binding protein [Deltaproteobacteria bacterium]|jgi:carbon-monoxide dehydrogenase small subunit|nr:(2Fe-2S)-binding protein [Deltaproteobacteria bacterium]MBW2483719.1 (2Fe-2S)-binding protein [Deltaproteobacteria bacterium]
MNTINIRIQVNGSWQELAVKPDDRLIDVLRDQLDLTGTKEGCGQGECGTCTVNLNGHAVLSCLILAAQADNCAIVTIEGLHKGSELHPLQRAFVSEAAVQCGYCTPGMIMAAKPLIDMDAEASEGKIRQHLSNNLCRCTGYDQPVRAVLKAAKEIKEDTNA